MDACAVIRARFRRGGAPKSMKVGHGGTLDPLATGVLVILVGRQATRLSDTIMAGEKRYIAEVDLAHVSNTDDYEGLIEKIEIAQPPTRAQIEEELTNFVGDIQQAPPAHSAVWIGGKRAYELARAGADPQMGLRSITIHSIDITRYEWPLLELDVRCAKGVYIRSLARDLGAALRVGGMLSNLRRTQVGTFTIDRARTLESLPDAMTQADLLALPKAASSG
jgi:tRNA pseudouridine55 synthase